MADIRSFFGGGATAKKQKETTKPSPTTAEPTKRKSQSSIKRDRSLSKERCQTKTTPHKVKNKKSVTKVELEEDEVNIISDTDSDDFTALKKNKGKKKSKKDKENGKKEAVSPEGAKENSTRRVNRKQKKVAKISSEEDGDLEVEVASAAKRSKKSSKKKAAVIYDSGAYRPRKIILKALDDSADEEPLPEKPKAKSRTKKAKLIEDSASGEEEEHKKPSIKEAFMKVAGKSATKPGKASTSPASTGKQISLTDFFGIGSVQRTEKKSHPMKRKQEESPVKQALLDEDDMEIHEDEDFEETLKQLDVHQPAKRIKMETVDTLEETGKQVGGKSLAAKLAEKSRKDQILVPDTPDKPEKKKSPLKLEKSLAPKVVTSSSNKAKQSSSTPTKKHLPLEENMEPPELKPTPTKSFTQGPSKSPPKTSPTANTPGGKKGVSYRSYLHREGPKALGSKEIPEGADNCLEGSTFIITGVLESMERDEATHLVEKYGGKVTKSLSKKTSYLVVGRDAGESKLAKASSLGTKLLDEDSLLDLIRSKPGKKSKYLEAAEKAMAQEAKSQLSQFRRKPSQLDSPQMKASPNKSSISSPTPSTSSSQSQKHSQISSNGQSEDALLWVDKHKPQSLKQIIGQQGDKSNARKLANWLQNWHKNVAAGKKPAFNRFSDDGSGYKAALLSGPPGVGKTTTSQLVCKEMSFSYVELNASDTRSKKSLQTEVSEALNNHTLVDFMVGSGKPSNDGLRHCLIMDEVDGMAGNEDRGGVQELIQLIKHSKIPIICMCNDRNHQKIRSLANYCFDLRFQRPRVEQIKAAMMTMAFKEGLKIAPPALNEIILAANQDVRQVIHNLSMWTANDKAMTYEQAKKDSAKAQKDLKLGPFDVCRKVFVSGEETANMTINDKSDLFFHDYSFGPLFVQENYIHCNPRAARGDVRLHLQLLSRAADSIAQGDLVDRSIRSRQNWGLLPVQAIYASVVPGEIMRGGIGQMIQFPSWLGKNSSKGKNDRLLQQLQGHMTLNVSSSKQALNQDYLPHLRASLTKPLLSSGSEGVSDVIKHLVEYDLTREDFDSVLEVTTWPHSTDPMSKVESKVKAAFTRAFNKENHLSPYATGTMSKRSRGGGGASMEEQEGEEAASREVSSEDEDDISKDTMIKQKKKTNAAAKKEKGSTSGPGKKGKGRGKGKGSK